MRSLYEITTSYINLRQLLERIEEDEIDEESIQTIMNTLEGEVTEKGANIAALIRNIEHLANGIKQAEDTLKERRKKLEKKIDNIKNYLLFNMQQCGINKITCPLFEISLRQKAASVEIIDESKIPEMYIRTKIIKEPDKIAIKDCLSKGQVIAGVKLSDPNKNFTLIIK